MKKISIRDLKECPECHCSWDGGNIFEIQRKQDWWKVHMTEDELKQDLIKSYGEGAHYSLLIGFEDPSIYDGVCRWVCPKCRTQ